MSWLNIKHYTELAPWLAVPLMWPEPGLENVAFAQSPEAWASEFAEGWWEDFGTEEPRPGEVELLKNKLLLYANRAPGIWPGADIFLHIPHPKVDPLMVFVDLVEITEEDPDKELRTLTYADVDGVVEPPIVENFNSPYLGTGLRVLRYYQDEDSNEVHAGLRYAWRYEKGTEAVNVLIVLSFPEPARIIRAFDDLDEFARIIRISPDEEKEAWFSQ